MDLLAEKAFLYYNEDIKNYSTLAVLFDGGNL